MWSEVLLRLRISISTERLDPTRPSWPVCRSSTLPKHTPYFLMLGSRQSLASAGKLIRRQCIRHNSTAPTISSSRIYCQNLLQKYDYPSYLQIPFLPQGSRDAHLAICALNVELALIPETVANQNARVMRMQFWKDALENCFQGRPKAEPVSILLAEVLTSGTRLTKSFFNTIISERVHSPLKTFVDTASSLQH